MQKNEKIIFLLVVSIVILWILSILTGIPSGTYTVYRELAVGLILIIYFIYFNYTFVRKWQKRIEESDSVETALAKHNYFPICTSEEGVIIYCNDKFLKLLGYSEMVFVAGRHLREIFNKDTYAEIENFMKSSENMAVKYISGYIYNRFRSYIAVNTIVQKFVINGKKYEHFEIVSEEFLNLITDYLPKNLTNVLNSIEDAIVFMDTKQNIKWINVSGQHLLNSDPKESLTGKKCYEAFWGKNENCDNCIASTEVKNAQKYETNTQLPNGRYIFIRCEPVRDEKGELTGIIIIVRDITEEKESEKKRLETENRLAIIAEQLPTLIWTTDENLRLTYVNGTILNLLKISTENMLGRTFYELFDTNDPEHPVIKHALLALTGETGSYQIRIMGRNYIVYYKPFINTEGRITGCAGVSQDITELIQVQKELEERNQILALIGGINRIISNSKSEDQLTDEIISLMSRNNNIKNVVYFSKDNKRDSIVINKSAKKDRLTEYLSEIKLSESDTSSNPVVLCYLDMEIKKINDAEKDLNDSPLGSVFAECGYKSAIFIPVIVDTRVYSILALVSDNKSSFKNSDYYINIAGDISVAISNFILQERQKENEEIIRKNQMMIVKAQKYEYASRFASSLAHDFNNILFSIKSYLEIIRAGINTDNRTENYLNQINLAIQKGGELTSYLMKYSTYESMVKETTSVSVLYKSFQERLSELCRTKSVSFFSENRCPDLSVLCDKEKLTEAIELCARYLINRTRIDSPLSLTIDTIFIQPQITASGEENQENMIKIELMSGTVLSDEILSDDIFEIKLLGQKDEQPEFNLPVVSNIIRLHGGYIYSDRSREKSGFIIILPLIYDKSDSSIRKFIIPENDRNIMIVEDDPYVKEPLEIILKDLKCNILTAPDGAEALKLAASINFNIHLLITDVEMPVIDGITLAEEIHKKNSKIKIIYMSGYIKDFAS